MQRFEKKEECLSHEAFLKHFADLDRYSYLGAYRNDYFKICPNDMLYQTKTLQKSPAHSVAMLGLIFVGLLLW